MQYRELIAPAVDLSFREENGFGVCAVGASLAGDIGGELYRFVVEILFSTIVTVLRDLISDKFVATRVKLAYNCTRNRSPRFSEALYEEVFDCPASFGQETTEMIFESSWLDAPSKRADQITFQLVRGVCDEMLGSAHSAGSTAGNVQEILFKSMGHFPTIDAMGHELNLSERTLRRRLTNEGTSYDALIRDVRMSLSKKYLRETSMTVEDIAERVGYCDASNFRRAFRRWTGIAPAHFRKRGVKSEPASGFASAG